MAMGLYTLWILWTEIFATQIYVFGFYWMLALAAAWLKEHADLLL